MIIPATRETIIELSETDLKACRGSDGVYRLRVAVPVVSPADDFEAVLSRWNATVEQQSA